MSVAPIRVDLGARSYDIHIGEGLLARIGDFLPSDLATRPLFVVTDSNVAPRWGETLGCALTSAGCDLRETIVVPAGEISKSFDRLEAVLAALFAAGLERRSVLMALGGGVVGDLAGFAAAIALRGIDFVQVPTTLLAQIDSSVGGKTGINTRYGKNLVGSFHQPRLVLIDTTTLTTLDARQLEAGYAELVKYGLIDDACFFDWLEKGGKALLAGDTELRTTAISKACAAKARIVAADERETGERALLNLGHGFGHALEAVTGFSDTLLHGEAVAVGMCLAFDLSVQLGLCPAEDARRVRAHLQDVGLPVDPPEVDMDEVLIHMIRDKKVVDGAPVLILARGIGRAFVARNVSMAQIGTFLKKE